MILGSSSDKFELRIHGRKFYAVHLKTDIRGVVAKVNNLRYILLDLHA